MTEGELTYALIALELRDLLPDDEQFRQALTKIDEAAGSILSARKSPKKKSLTVRVKSSPFRRIK